MFVIWQVSCWRQHGGSFSSHCLYNGDFKFPHSNGFCWILDQDGFQTVCDVTNRALGPASSCQIFSEHREKILHMLFCRLKLKHLTGGTRVSGFSFSFLSPQLSWRMSAVGVPDMWTWHRTAVLCRPLTWTPTPTSSCLLWVSQLHWHTAAPSHEWYLMQLIYHHILGQGASGTAKWLDYCYHC